uniref:PRE_C2HC domain-containing protein n=1 Tax=Parastrongyloides trichosuri TaxID=131310 RepID=A0A0N4ZFC4_PARTI
MKTVIASSDRVLRKRKIFHEQNNDIVYGQKIAPKVRKIVRLKKDMEITNKTHVPVYHIEQRSSLRKPTKMIFIVQNNDPSKVEVEPTFVSPNTEEVALRRRLCSEAHTSYLKILHQKERQITISKWNVDLNKRITFGNLINASRYLRISSLKNTKNDIDKALFNLYHKVNDEIYDASGKCIDISSCCNL